MTEVFLEQIDQFISAPKEIFGVVQWQFDLRGSAVVFKALLGFGGDTSAGVCLHGRAAYDSHPQWLQLTIAWKELRVERLSFRPATKHTNSFAPSSPSELRGLRFSALESRYYSWADNRQLPKAARAEIARPLPVEITSIPAAIAYMLDRTRIAGTIPAPQHQARLIP